MRRDGVKEWRLSIIHGGVTFVLGGGVGVDVKAGRILLIKAQHDLGPCHPTDKRHFNPMTTLDLLLFVSAVPGAGVQMNPKRAWFQTETACEILLSCSIAYRLQPVEGKEALSDRAALALRLAGPRRNHWRCTPRGPGRMCRSRWHSCPAGCCWAQVGCSGLLHTCHPSCCSRAWAALHTARQPLSCHIESRSLRKKEGRASLS